MNKELQDLVWSILPKEFKEEVKKMYKVAQSYIIGDVEINARVCESVLLELFGRHNLNSDAEGEEMLTVPRSKVQHQYNRAVQLQDDSDFKWNFVGDQIARVLIGLFFSKCLPDNANEDNFVSKEHSIDSLKVRELINVNELSIDEFVKSEPKYHVGQKVIYKKKGTVKTVIGVDYVSDETGVSYYYDTEDSYGNSRLQFKENELEPYPEPATIQFPRIRGN